MDDTIDGTFWANRAGLLRSLHEVFLSLNIACAFVYALCLYVARSFFADAWQNNSGYYFFRGAVRVSDLLHRSPATPVATGAVARGDSILWSSGTITLTVLATILGFAAVVYLLVRVFDSRPEPRALAYRLLGPIALFFTPASCVAIWLITWKWENIYSDVRTPFGHYLLLLAALCGEFICFVAVLRYIRKHKVSNWVAPILPLHFAFWGFILFPNFILYIGESRARLLVHLSAWLLPAAGTAFLIYVRPGDWVEGFSVHSVGRWPFIAAAIGMVVLISIWTPPIGRGAILAGSGRSTIVQLSRGSCFGACPVYTVTIHGDGSVEFDGKELVRLRGKQTSQITDAQFARIIGLLDRVYFADLDDRAFSWCFDTPSVSVAVAANGHIKRVSSDYACVGSKSGLQSQFVSATDEIEAIVNTDPWVKCGTRSCR